MNISIGKAGRKRWLGAGATKPRVSMNTDRSPAWRERRPTLGGRHPGHAWGKTTKGKEDPYQQVAQQIHSPKPNKRKK